MIPVIGKKYLYANSNNTYFNNTTWIITEIIRKLDDTPILGDISIKEIRGNCLTEDKGNLDNTLLSFEEFDDKWICLEPVIDKIDKRNRLELIED